MKKLLQLNANLSNNENKMLIAARAQHIHIMHVAQYTTTSS